MVGLGQGRRLVGRARALVVVGAVIALTALAPASPAQAHAFLETSTPADGAVVATAPATLRLGFSESVVLGAMRIEVVDAQGRQVAPTGLRLQSEGAPEDIENPVQVVADLPTLARGVYRVSWETLSSDDLHRTAGVLVFGVGTGQSVQAAGSDEPAPRVGEASLRWLVLLSLALCLGGALAARLLSRDHRPAPASAALAAGRWSLVGAVAGPLAAVGLLGYQLSSAGAPARELLAGAYGERWLLRECGLVLLLVSTVLARRARLPRVRAVLLVVGVSVAGVGAALLGHAGAASGLALTWLVADTAHLVAAATWTGTLVVLVAVVGPRLRTGALGADDARGALRGFSLPAAACVSVMGVTGVYLTSEVVGSVDAALLTVYGRALLLKVAVAAAAGAMALVTVLRLRRGRGLRRGRALPLPRRALVAEAGAALVALGLAAVLTSGQPAQAPQFLDSPATVASRLVNGPVADLQEALSIRPNRPGDNVVLVDVFDTRRPSLGPVREVLVSVVGASGASQVQRAEPLSDGRWSLATGLKDSGPIQVQVVARRTGLPDATRTFAWTVGGGRAHTQAALVSTAPVGSVLRGLAAVLLGLVLALWALVLLASVRRRRRTGRTPERASAGDPTTRLDHAAPALVP